MAHMNFDKAIAHFSAAHESAITTDQKALMEIATGLQRLAEALHHDVEFILKTLRESDKKKA